MRQNRARCPETSHWRPRYTTIRDSTELSRSSQEDNADLGTFASSRSKHALITQAQSYLGRLTAAQAKRYDATLERVRGDVHNLALFMTDVYAQPDTFRVEPPDAVTADPANPSYHLHVPSFVELTAALEQELVQVGGAYYQIRTILQANPAIMAGYVGTSSGIMFRLSDSVREHASDWDPRTRPWFEDASASDELIWTDIYLDAVDGIPHLTGTQAFRRPDGTVAGVAAADIPLRAVIDDLNDLRIGASGHAFIVDANGTFIADTRADADDLP